MLVFGQRAHKPSDGPGPDVSLLAHLFAALFVYFPTESSLSNQPPQPPPPPHPHLFFHLFSTSCSTLPCINNHLWPLQASFLVCRWAVVVSGTSVAPDGGTHETRGGGTPTGLELRAGRFWKPAGAAEVLPGTPDQHVSSR